MQPARFVLLALLAIVAVVYSLSWATTLTRRRQWQWPTWFEAIVGFVTDFLDTLGIGSFAVTTSLYRIFHNVETQLLPGTLNVGHALPTIAQALIFIAIIEVDSVTLGLLIVASVAGAWLGASVVAALPRIAIKRGMAYALLVAAALMLMNRLEVLPGGGTALKLVGAKLVLAMGCNFLFGALMTIGVGAYAPIMVMVSLLGMDQSAAFPIMMGSCAFLMPAASSEFLRSGRYHIGAALGLTLLGVPGVLLAAPLVGSLPLQSLNWLVLIVVIYTAVMMLRTKETGVADSKRLAHERK